MPPQVATETGVGDEVPDDDVSSRDDQVGGGPEPDQAAPFARVESESAPADEGEDSDGSAVLDPGDDTDPAALGDDADGDDVVPGPPTDATRRSVRQRLRARQLQARKVRRTIRHVDPWSVLKFAVFFFALIWMVVIMAGVVLWSLAVNSGLVTEFEDLVIELFDLTSFTIDADLMFRVSVMAGAAMALGGALFMGVLAVLFNLLSDLLGGIRVSVIEEETARRMVE